MNDPLLFVRARLAEEEEIALSASPGPWRPDEEYDEVLAVDGITVADGFALSGRQLRATVEHIAHHHPARVLAEVEMKRQLLKRGGTFCNGRCDDPDSPPMDPDTDWTTPLEHHLDCSAYEAAKGLATAYADHAEYDEAWRP